MLLGSKQTSAPSSEARSSCLMRSSRARRRRSKSIRCSQSTPINPKVLPISTPPWLDLTSAADYGVVAIPLNEERAVGSMTVEANPALDLIDRHFAAENAHDIDATIATYTHDSVWDDVTHPGSPFRGKAAVAGAYGGIL